MTPSKFLAFVGALITSCGLASAAAPANDSFASAEILPSQLSVSVDGTTIDATRQPGDPGDNVTVWYQWTAPASGRVKISAVSTADHRAGVFIGDDVQTAYYIADDTITDSTPLKFYAIKAITYHICIYSIFSSDIYHAPFDLGLSEDRSLEASNTKYQEPYVNDDFDQSLILTKRKVSFVQYVAGATFEAFEKEMLASVGVRPSFPKRGGTWVQWTAPVTGRAYFSARTIYGRQVILIAGKGDSIANLKIKAAKYDSLSFPCIVGKEYRLYMLSLEDHQVVAKIEAIAGASIPSP